MVCSRLVAEVEEDKKLDGKHAVEEAMSGWVNLYCLPILILLPSPCSDAELSKVPERFVLRLSSRAAVLNYVLKAFIKEYGVRLCLQSLIQTRLCSL